MRIAGEAPARHILPCNGSTRLALLSRDCARVCGSRCPPHPRAEPPCLLSHAGRRHRPFAQALGGPFDGPLAAGIPAPPALCERAPTVTSSSTVYACMVADARRRARNRCVNGSKKGEGARSAARSIRRGVGHNVKHGAFGVARSRRKHAGSGLPGHRAPGVQARGACPTPPPLRWLSGSTARSAPSRTLRWRRADRPARYPGRLLAPLSRAGSC